MAGIAGHRDHLIVAGAGLGAARGALRMQDPPLSHRAGAQLFLEGPDRGHRAVEQAGKRPFPDAAVRKRNQLPARPLIGGAAHGDEFVLRIRRGAGVDPLVLFAGDARQVARPRRGGQPLQEVAALRSARERLPDLQRLVVPQAVRAVAPQRVRSRPAGLLPVLEAGVAGQTVSLVEIRMAGAAVRMDHLPLAHDAGADLLEPGPDAEGARPVVHLVGAARQVLVAQHQHFVFRTQWPRHVVSRGHRRQCVVSLLGRRNRPEQCHADGNQKERSLHVLRHGRCDFRVILILT